MERQLAELAKGASKKKRSGSRGSRRDRGKAAAKEKREQNGEEKCEDLGLSHTDEFNNDANDDDGGSFLDINGLTAAAASQLGSIPSMGGGHADSLRQSVNYAERSAAYTKS